MSNFSVGNNVFDKSMHVLGRVVSSDGVNCTITVLQGTGTFEGMEGTETTLPVESLEKAVISEGDVVKVLRCTGESLVGKTGVVAWRGSDVGVDFFEEIIGLTHNLDGRLEGNTGRYFGASLLEIVQTPRLKDIYHVGQTAIVRKEAFSDNPDIEGIDFGEGVNASIVYVHDGLLGIEILDDIGFPGHDLRGQLSENNGWYVMAHPFLVSPVKGGVIDVSDQYKDVIGLRAVSAENCSFEVLTNGIGKITQVRKVERTGAVYYATTNSVISEKNAIVIPDYTGKERGVIRSFPSKEGRSRINCVFLPEYGLYFDKEFAATLFLDELTNRHELKDKMVEYVNAEGKTIPTTSNSLISHGINPVAYRNKLYDESQIVCVADKYGEKFKRLKSEVDTTEFEYCNRHKCYYPKDLEMCPVCVMEYGSLDEYGHEQHDEYDTDAFYSLDTEKSEDFGGLYYGVEIESEQGDRADSRDMKYFIAKLNTQFDDIFSCKHDGSLDGSGVESVTKPLSLRYHLETDLWDRFNACAKKHARISHDTTDCGFHVHFSRTPFEDKDIDDYESEITLAYEKYYPEWKKISRRPMRSNHYCEYLTERGGIDTAKETWTKDKVKENMCRDRYLAVNTTNSYTVEIRIFRGTIVASTIRATLWLVNAVNQYILNGNSVEDCKSFNELIGYDTAPDFVKEYLYKRGL